MNSTISAISEVSISNGLKAIRIIDTLNRVCHYKNKIQNLPFSANTPIIYKGQGKNFLTVKKNIFVGKRPVLNSLLPQLWQIAIPLILMPTSSFQSSKILHSLEPNEHN